LWGNLSIPWQACLELAWEAYCDDCIPIGAVVTDAGGNILSRGRNRIYENKVRRGSERGAELAHAEVEALRLLDIPAIDPHSCILYTTTEPCPMCMGTFYMSGIRTLYYASRDPYAGSVNLLGTTWYLSRKQIKVFGPSELALENLIAALFVEQDCDFHEGTLPEGNFYQRLGQVLGEGVALGQRLWQTGELRKLRGASASAEQMVNRVAFVK
jgi:tRNA(Arg) A34 adenosine deaminase TadA